MSDKVRGAFEKWERDNGYEMSSFQQDRWSAYQAATAAADAEWRGVVEKLVEAGLAIINSLGDEPAEERAIIKWDNALAQAQQLLGRRL